MLDSERLKLLAPWVAVAVAVWVGWHAVRVHRLTAAKLLREERERKANETGQAVAPPAVAPPDPITLPIVLDGLCGLFRSLCHLVGFVIGCMAIAAMMDRRSWPWHVLGWALMLAMISLNSISILADKNIPFTESMVSDPHKDRLIKFWLGFGVWFFIVGGATIMTLYIDP